MSPLGPRHDLIMRGLAERRRRMRERETNERELKELKAVKDEYYLDLEAEAFLKCAVDLLFKEYGRLPNDQKRRVVKELSLMLNENGPPEKPLKLLLREVVNKVRGE